MTPCQGRRFATLAQLERLNQKAVWNNYDRNQANSFLLEYRKILLARLQAGGDPIPDGIAKESASMTVPDPAKQKCRYRMGGKAKLSCKDSPPPT